MILLGSILALALLAVGVVVHGSSSGKSPSRSDDDRRGWAQRMKSVIASELSELSSAARDLVLVQAAYESGFGTSKASAVFNYWNLTRAASDTRPILEGGDTAYDAFGKLLGAITQRFRAYESIEAGVRGLDGYLPFLSTPHYALALDALKNGDESDFLFALRLAGFFTLPLADYKAGFAATRGDLVRLGVIA